MSSNEPRFARQLSAIGWIAVAWIVGMLVFEMTAAGDETSSFRVVRVELVQNQAASDEASTR